MHYERGADARQSDGGSAFNQYRAGIAQVRGSGAPLIELLIFFLFYWLVTKVPFQLRLQDHWQCLFVFLPRNATVFQQKCSDDPRRMHVKQRRIPKCRKLARY
jgi:hypothetical protein